MRDYSDMSRLQRAEADVIREAISLADINGPADRTRLRDCVRRLKEEQEKVRDFDELRRLLSRDFPPVHDNFYRVD